MQKIKIRLSSRQNGENFISECEGAVEECGGETKFVYPLNGDGCELTVRADGSVTQTRRGSINIEMEFVRGEKTFCRISDGAFCGEFPVFCESAEFAKDEKGYNLKLRYSQNEINGDEGRTALEFAAALK